MADRLRTRACTSNLRASCVTKDFWVKLKMAIFSVYVLNRAGGLIYHYDHHTPKSEIEKTFSYPLDITLRGDDKLEVIFGEGGGIKGIKVRLSDFQTQISNLSIIKYHGLGEIIYAIPIFYCS